LNQSCRQLFRWYGQPFKSPLFAGLSDRPV